MSLIKRYSELSKFDNYKDRYEYLKLSGNVGEETFGYDRYLNQLLYTSDKWRKFRRDIIIRDEGNDMAHRDFPIGKFIIVHHMNPITPEQLENRDPVIFDPEFVVCVSDRTHKAIHYGDFDLLPKPPIERKPNDTSPWRL